MLAWDIWQGKLIVEVTLPKLTAILKRRVASATHTLRLRHPVSMLMTGPAPSD